VDDEVKAIEEFLIGLGSSILKKEIWGRRDLFYPIKKKHQGVYVVFTILGESSLVAGLERRLRISDQVLRHLVVRIDEEQSADETSLQRRTTEESEESLSLDQGLA